MIIATSDQGYTTNYYKVDTSCPISRMEEIDIKYGSSWRFQSTTIDELIAGIFKEGYTATYARIEKPSILQRLFKTYTARYGNY